MATKTNTPVKFVKVSKKQDYTDYQDKDGALIFVESERKIYVDGIAYGFSDADVANKFVKLTGDTMTGDLGMGGKSISDVLDITGKSSQSDTAIITFGDGSLKLGLYEQGNNIEITEGLTEFSTSKIKGIPTLSLSQLDNPDYTSSPVNVGLLKSAVLDKKGKAGGFAELGSDGKVPSGHLPSYVDDVLEYPNRKSFPAEGEAGKLYIDTDTNTVWRWSGSIYVNVADGNAHLQLGTTSSTAYRGDFGQEAFQHISKTDNPHGVTKEQIYLGRVEDYEIATTKEAQDGETNTAYMTPLRTKEAIEKLAPKLSWTVVA